MYSISQKHVSRHRWRNTSIKNNVYNAIALHACTLKEKEGKADLEDVERLAHVACREPREGVDAVLCRLQPINCVILAVSKQYP